MDGIEFMIHLAPITWDNFEAVIALSVHDHQKGFVASNVFSLAQSYVALLNDPLPPMSFAIQNDDEVVGFVMMYHDDAEENEYADEACYGICRFMIGKQYQGKGYGKQALALALDYIKTFPQGEDRVVYISYVPENTVVRKLYAEFGFVETGQINDDGEVVARLEF